MAVNVTVAAASDASDASGTPAGSPAADDHYRVTAVSILGATLELTIAPPVPEDREAVVGYTPGTRPLRTAAGAAVPNFNVTVSAAAPPPPPPPPAPTNRAPAFDPSEYAFELREHVDGSAQPVALGAVTAADPDGDALAYALAAGDSARFAVGSADGAVSYIGPGEDYETEPNVFELTVQARDPGGLSAEASVTVTIVNVVELPVAADDAVATDEDVAVEIDVLANDADPEGNGLRVASVSAAEQGSAEITADGRAVRYTPAENWHGTDRFTYVAEDANGATSEASVEVTVRPVNDLPEAADDEAATDEDVAVTVDVLANDTDVDGDSLRVASVSAPANGTAAVAADGRGVLYTPAENWHGTDRFTYVADDGNGGTASASVEVTVAPVNDLPVAVDDRVSTNEDEAVTVDVLANDTDPDGDGLSLVSVSAPGNGTARIAAGVVLYMPAANFSGTDRFTYEIEDDGGARASAAVEVTVLPTNDAPMPVGTIPAQTLEEGGDPARIELSPFFEDADGDVLAYGTVSSDSSVVRATVAGSVLTLVPAGYGRVVVVVAARDAGGLTATQAVAVGVSDGAARGMVSHALAGMARSHLASARMTLGRRPMASRSDASRLSLMGRDVPLSLGAAKSAAEQRWQGWLSGITSRAMSYARADSGSSSSPDSPGDDPTLGDLFRFGDLVGDLTRFDGGRDPLRGSEFQFGFDVGGGQEAGGGGGGGLRLQLWGQGDVQTFRGAPSDGDSYDGELQTGYVGLDTWLGSRFMLGVAVARSQGTGDWRTGATSGALQTRLVAVHPYLQWTSGATSIWAMGGVGQGDADNVRDGNGLAETSDLGLRMGLVELRRRLAAGGGFSLALRADAGWAELQTETGSETLDGQTAAVDQLRLGAELSQQIRLGGLTLNPFGEAHVRRDGGAGQPGTGLELIGGLKAKAGFLRIDAQGRMLAVHSATGYEEQGFSATLSLGSQGGTGPSLSVSPRWGDLASGGGDALWQEQVYSRHAAAPAAAPAPAADGAALARDPRARDPWAVDVRGGYGIRIPGNHLLTWSASVNHSPVGPRFTTALKLGFGSSRTPRKETPPLP
ncbi:MAG: tandem-95 repeat protein [Gemmatimonadota bacterium]|nr:tandem-95 repeat protein [Gemmatimonadota bacterium]